MAAADSTAFRALSDVVLAIASEHEVEPVLQLLVHSARELAGARYAALGIPDGDGAFESFITSGMSDELIEAMGPLPRTHGMLGAMLDSATPHLTDDITADPRFRGWWPSAHPQMRSFLGVPIVARGEVIGAVYLTEKEDGSMFSAADQKLIELLAAHAAIAIENARLHERSRELSIIEERNRLARELHDAVTQRLFAVALAAESASTLLARDRERSGGEPAGRDSGAAAELRRVSELARGAMEELRAVVFELRPGSMEAEGLATVLRKHVDVLCRVYERRIDLRVCDVPRLAPGPATQVLRIAQEALGNALRHAGADEIDVRLHSSDGVLVLTVSDDGCGFDPTGPEVRGQRLGLTSMEERATELGGNLRVTSTLGEGTTVRLEVPVP
jgi:signal transduction histidine kinase